MKNRIIGLLVALALAGIAALGVALPSAQAADTNVYVVVNDRVCSPGYGVYGILGNVQPTGWTKTSWDLGDNIIYPKVRLHQKNTAHLEVQCVKRTAGRWQKGIAYYGPVVHKSFTPTKYKQTIWIG